jgi:hypothetical protein
MPVLDDDIREVEVRLARRRDGLAVLGGEWVEALRDTLVSGRSLLGVAAFGFALGEMLRPRSGGAAPAGRGAGGVLLALASILLRARFGSPWQIAWSAVQAWRRQRPAGTPVATRAPVYRDSPVYRD